MKGLYSPKVFGINKFQRSSQVIIVFMALVPLSTLIARNTPPLVTAKYEFVLLILTL